MERQREVFSLRAYEDIVVGTATQLAQTYVKCRAAKKASQHASSMLKLSMPKAMTDEASATKGVGGTISPQAPTTCTMCSSLLMASSTWSVEYPRAVNEASVISDWTTGLPTQSSQLHPILLPQIVHSQSGYTRPPHDNMSYINERPKLAPTPHKAPYGPTLTFNLPITGPVVVSTCDHIAMTGAIAAQRYQELSLRLQQEYHQSLPKPLVDYPSKLESSMSKSGMPYAHARKSESDWCSESSMGSQRDPTVPFRSIID